ncbi:hypothetical protein ACUJ46_07825 [Sandaracinobacteroides sp. A072]|uniref:hypothetical protein n=1 Tax=Sandaracinobacteroides sp. A072 TaxID=3461146 RepID=UPI0040438B9F
MTGNPSSLVRAALLSAAMLAMPVPAVAGQQAGGAAEGSDARSQAPEALRLWVDARAGTGKPVHWVAEGGVYDYPSGRKLFGMVGFDSSKVIWPEKPGDPILHLTRKTFAYTHPETGEILKEWNGKPVTPIAYPYQLIRYRMEDGRIHADVEQGAGDDIRHIRSGEGMRMRWMGRDTLAVTAPVFLDLPLPGGARYEAWENYDFFLHRPGTVSQPHQMSWQRYGALPPFAGKGKAIYHLLSWRVERHEDFPPAILEWARREKPMWLVPPADVAEIRRLQTVKAGEGWAQ